MSFRILVLLGSLAAVCAPAARAGTPDAATAFGSREVVQTAAISADGKKVVFVGASDGASTIAVVVDLETGATGQVARADGNPATITHCGWSAADRIVCSFSSFERFQSVLLPIVRTVAMDLDGKDPRYLGQKESIDQIAIRLSDGEVVDWLSGVDGAVLMARNFIPESNSTGLAVRTYDGLGVVRVDTRTGKATLVERVGKQVDSYISDGLGNIRIMKSVSVSESGYATGEEIFSYRPVNGREWRRLGSFVADRRGGGRGQGIVPLAVDPRLDSAYVLDTLEGRRALYRIVLDETLARTLVFASKEVDVDGVVTIGRAGRVIGAKYTTDRRHVAYFDADYKNLHDALARALPKDSLIDFVSASADESVLLVHASSDVDPGSFHVYNRNKKSLLLLSSVRPALKGMTLSPVKAIEYPAADGTMIPAYLTLPPGVTEAKNLPAIVMPHGGTDSRGEWGFDWLAQYFAQRGFAVIQPNFRGSGGYGNEWFANNGFRGWRTSVGDVCDAGRWLVGAGYADPKKLAAFGWAYGGYAALQANVLDANLFSAVIAVAPVTDLELLKSKRMPYMNAFVQADFIGSGPHVTEGSPAANPQAFRAPVLMFHGDTDPRVDVSQSRRMELKLREARKAVRLIEYPKLEHSLRDSTARADLLRRSDEFLRKNLKL